MDEEVYYESEGEDYESEAEESIEEQEEETIDDLDPEIEKEKEKEVEEEEESDLEEDMSEFFESNIIPDTKETKSSYSTIENITNEKTENRKTLPILSKYEKTKIIGIRAQQIAMGSYVYLDGLNGISNPLDIAKEELRQKRTPLLVRRTIPSKKGNVYEDWKIEELVDVFEDL
jgi:DNA-directed RNA polymerase I, II, and III subunit RPABC2